LGIMPGGHARIPAAAAGGQGVTITCMGELRAHAWHNQTPTDQVSICAVHRSAAMLRCHRMVVGIWAARNRQAVAWPGRCCRQGWLGQGHAVRLLPTGTLLLWLLQMRCVHAAASWCRRGKEGGGEDQGPAWYLALPLLGWCPQAVLHALPPSCDSTNTNCCHARPSWCCCCRSPAGQGEGGCCPCPAFDSLC